MVAIRTSHFSDGDVEDAMDGFFNSLQVRRRISVWPAAAILIGGKAAAYSDGAPWGAADPTSARTCASCHFAHEPVHASEALTLDGLPDRPEPGKVYDLELTFRPRNGAVAGFQLFVHSDDGAIVGNTPTTESNANVVRSKRPSPINGATSWRIRWRAPDELRLPITIQVACMAANDDDSPFGDFVHYRTFTITGS